MFHWKEGVIVKIKLDKNNFSYARHLKKPVQFYKRDIFTKKYYIYGDVEDIPATAKQVKGLELAAVWEAECLLERLNKELV
jgi:hypothetical protein